MLWYKLIKFIFIDQNLSKSLYVDLFHIENDKIISIRYKSGKNNTVTIHEIIEDYFYF